MNRPRVSLDPIAAMLDRALEHPLARILEHIAPDVVEGARTVRANLPEVAAGIEAEMVEQAAAGAEDIAGDVGRALRRRVDRLIRKGSPARPPRRLGPAKKKAGKGKKR